MRYVSHTVANLLTCKLHVFPLTRPCGGTQGGYSVCYKPQYTVSTGFMALVAPAGSRWGKHLGTFYLTTAPKHLLLYVLSFCLLHWITIGLLYRVCFLDIM